jgi:hypothetical protein
MTINLIRSRRVAWRAIALTALLVALTAASTRVRADIETTATCGGVSVTLPFTDVAANNSFFCAIAEAYFSGLTNGTSATTFSPTNPVSREQMSAFITRTLDQSLKRGSRRAALKQWHIPKSNYLQKRTQVGAYPLSVACDGADLWVANNGSDTISRVRASDGKLLQTWTGAIDAKAICVAGGRVYAAGISNSRIYMIDPSQSPGPVTVSAAQLGGFPLAITTDGLSIWTANLGSGVSKVSADGLVQQTYTAGLTSTRGIVYDGASIWVTDSSVGGLLRLDINGNIVQTVPTGSSPNYPVFDGLNIWVPNFSDDSVTVVRAATGQVVATLSGNGLDDPYASAFDGERILVTNYTGGSVSLWRATDLAPLGVHSFLPNSVPIDACSDGVNFWVLLSGTDSLLRF